jgi:hypothetical protein
MDGMDEMDKYGHFDSKSMVVLKSLCPFRPFRPFMPSLVTLQVSLKGVLGRSTVAKGLQAKGRP